MSGYSNDLRERIVAAREGGQPINWIAETYQVRDSSVKRDVRRYRETGSTAATVQRREQPLVGEAQRERIAAMVKGNREATLEAYCEQGQQLTGRQVSIQTMSRVLIRFGWPRKNRPSGRWSETKAPDRNGAR
jgi:transposase